MKTKTVLLTAGLYFLILNISLCQNNPNKVDYTGYLGESSRSVFTKAMDWRDLFAPDGSISESGKKTILDDLSVIYGTADNPIDSADLVKKIKENNLPLAGVLFPDDYSSIAASFEVRPSRGDGMNIVSILSDLVIGKTSLAAKSVLFKLLLNNIFEHPEAEILFPSTAAFFRTFEKSKITTSPRIFAESFKIDFKKLPFNTSKVFDKVEKYQRVLNERPDLRIYTEAYKYYQSFKNLDPIFKTNHITLGNLRGLKGYKTEGYHSELYNSLKLMQYIAFQLNTYDYTSFKGKSDLINNITSLEDDIILQDLYFGLICAQNPPVEFADTSQKNKNILSGAQSYSESNLYSTTQIINFMVKQGNQKHLMNYLAGYKDKYEKIALIKDTIDAYIEYDEPVPGELKDAYFEGGVEFLEYVLDPNNLFPGGKFDKSEINIFTDIIKRYRQIEYNIEQKENFAALMNSFYIYTNLCKTDSVFGPFFDVFSGNYLKAISILADLTSADTEEEMAQILNNYVFSGFSTDMKKESDFNLALNSYAGIYYGKESDAVKNNWTRNRGFTAPIGLELSRGLKDWGNLSLFLPVLDIGAVVDFELNNDSTETKTKFVIENVFSPGAYLIYGLPSIPMSVGGGFQFSPQLGKVTLNGSEIGPRKLRWNIFFAFDMPFLKILSF